MTTTEEKVLAFALELEKLKQQIYHLEGIVESEQGTLQREANRLRVEIKEIEDRFIKIIYADNGMMIKVDRLTQESNERKKTKQNIWGLWVAVVVIAIKEIIELFKR